MPEKENVGSDNFGLTGLEEIKKKKKFFSSDVWQEPCFRDTVLIGSSSGILGGLATFIVTSSKRKSFHGSFLSFIVTYTSYGLYCSYNAIKQQNAIEKMNEQIKKYHKDEPI